MKPLYNSASFGELERHLDAYTYTLARTHLDASLYSAFVPRHALEAADGVDSLLVISSFQRCIRRTAANFTIYRA